MLQMGGSAVEKRSPPGKWAIRAIVAWAGGLDVRDFIATRRCAAVP
jgi:hypothetical protein